MKNEASSKWEISGAAEMWEGMSLADLGHILSLLDAGIISKRKAAPLLGALLELEKAYPTKFKLNVANGDIYRNREFWLSQQVPQVYGYLAAGRARREATTVGCYLKVRSQFLDLKIQSIELAQTLLTLAQKHHATLMPDYTYLQPAQVTSFGHYLLSFVEPLKRDIQRLTDGFEKFNHFPGGIGSTNGSGLALNREKMASLLGFSAPVLHARDAMWQHDIMVEAYASLSSLLLNLSRMANDFHVWCSREFDFVELSGAATRSSVAMPQKVNPYLFSFARGAAHLMSGRAAGAAALGQTCTGQVDNRIFIYNELPGSFDLAAEAVASINKALKGIKINKKRMSERAAGSGALSSSAAELIMEEFEMGYSESHALVQAAIQEGSAGNLTSSIIEKLGAKNCDAGFRRKLAKSQSARYELDRKKDLGGAAPASVIKMIGAGKKLLTGELKITQKQVARIRAAEAKLRSRAARLAKI